MKQKFLSAANNYKDLDQYLIASGQNKLLLVCGNSIKNLKLNDYFLTLENRLV